MLSDEEENTSEYSHYSPPSSVHSTLESNSELTQMYKQQIQQLSKDEGNEKREDVRMANLKLHSKCHRYEIDDDYSNSSSDELDGITENRKHESTTSTTTANTKPTTITTEELVLPGPVIAQAATSTSTAFVNDIKCD